MVGANGYAQLFSTAELQWLYETLEDNRNKRCFVYQHIFLRDGSSDAADLNGNGDLLDNTPGNVFRSLMAHYKNVVCFKVIAISYFGRRNSLRLIILQCVWPV